ncbi:3-oxoacyl-[acyl-carrier-protein] synthase 2 [Paenibacillus sp. J31TS4]|uniref:beta-ketoacyl-ACP synthase II n=1 Tax=Paenibacillus sp. J31TS4 TaxID=2807195 RepID=UPI001B0BDAE7|nr:beta-ketoacyl-ACP synthase II [Paenibacillus sp. J31TS4]GIP39002.1 3-oxoacyl-[acyl-carrier-protein] synthase 2 [Paenibacillus sp. J31TS4]
MERVVVTGMGVVTPLGEDVGRFWSGLRAGESGITSLEGSEAGPRIRIAGKVRDFDGEGRFGRKEARRMDRFCQFALAAAEEAYAAAGLREEHVAGERAAVYVGSGVGGLGTLLAQADLLRERGPERVSPLLVPMMIPNMAAAMISMRYGITGPTLAPVTACSIGNTAIGEASRLIRHGGADVVFAGGAEAAIHELSLASFGNATALSARTGEPARASRPFDAGRDGFVMAEGAGIVVLESLRHAKRRQAPIYAEVIGYGASSDAYHMVATHPEGRGAAQAMRLALQDARIRPDEVDVVSAHATSTGIGDLSETAAIKQVFGEDAYRVPVTANKSMTGHLLGAASAVEAVALVKSLQEGIIPPTINLDDPDPACDLDYVPHTAREASMRIGISNSFGFGGHNAVLVLKRFES